MNRSLYRGIFIVAILASVTLANTPTEECQAELEACFRTYYSDYDQGAFEMCSNRAYQTYGRTTCMPCLANTEIESVALKSDTLEDCLVNCYLETLNTCDTGAQLGCQVACYPTPTQDDTEQCQGDLHDCYAQYLDDHDFADQRTCMARASFTYGPAACIPCMLTSVDIFTVTFATATLSTHQPHVEGFGSDLKECVLGCYDDFLDNCSQGDFMRCNENCINSSSLTLTESKSVVHTETKNSSVNWIFVAIAIACVAFSAGLVVAKKVGKKSDLYTQLQA
mmetsp:Transcript_51214/g.58707  ORF Transcript_51214/g.58707 Transcript_51214/m.58707 type:complete len:280 (-) Transcript_51214:145-984(-)